MFFDVSINVQISYINMLNISKILNCICASLHDGLMMMNMQYLEDCYVWWLIFDSHKAVKRSDL